MERSIFRHAYTALRSRVGIGMTGDEKWRFERFNALDTAQYKKKHLS